METRQLTSDKQLKLEIELILNRRLFQNNVIDRQVFGDVQDELLKEINKEIEKV